MRVALQGRAACCHCSDGQRCKGTAYRHRRAARRLINVVVEIIGPAEVIDSHGRPRREQGACCYILSCHRAVRDENAVQFSAAYAASSSSGWVIQHKIAWCRSSTARGGYSASALAHWSGCGVRSPMANSCPCAAAPTNPQQQRHDFSSHSDNQRQRAKHTTSPLQLNFLLLSRAPSFSRRSRCLGGSNAILANVTARAEIGT